MTSADVQPPRVLPTPLWHAATALVLLSVAFGVCTRAGHEAIGVVGGLVVAGIASVVVLGAFVGSVVFAPWSSPVHALAVVVTRGLFLGAALLIAMLTGLLTMEALLRWRVLMLDRDVEALRVQIDGEIERTGVAPEFLPGTYERSSTGIGIRLGGADVVYSRTSDSNTTYEITAHFANRDNFSYRSDGEYSTCIQERIGRWGYWASSASEW